MRLTDVAMSRQTLDCPSMLLLIALIAIGFESPCAADPQFGGPLPGGGALGTVDFTVSQDPTPSKPLALDTADQYLGNANFYGVSWDPALMALGVGSTDPEFRNVIDVRPFQTQEHLLNNADNPRTNVALDAGPMPCPGGFEIRTIDSFGRVSTVRVSTIPAGAGEESSFSKMGETDSEQVDWARQMVRFGQEVGKRHEVTLPIGQDRLSLSAQLNSDREAVVGDESWFNAGVTYTRRGSFSVTYNPTPMFDNQVINRLNVAIGKPGAATQFTIRNVAWRRAESYYDSDQVDGGAWIAGTSTALDRRSSLSAAVSEWSGSCEHGTDAALTEEYRATSDRVYGIGVLGSYGSVGPFASFARTLPGNGRFYLSFGAPLDDRTRVPVACRMMMPF